MNMYLSLPSQRLNFDSVTVRRIHEKIIARRGGRCRWRDKQKGVKKRKEIKRDYRHGRFSLTYILYLRVFRIIIGPWLWYLHGYYRYVFMTRYLLTRVRSRRISFVILVVLCF